MPDIREKILSGNLVNISSIITRLRELENELPKSESDKWRICEEYSELINLIESFTGENDAP